MAKSRKKYRVFLHILCPYPCVVFPIINSPHGVGCLLQLMNLQEHIIITPSLHFTLGLGFALGVIYSLGSDKCVMI